MITDNQTINIVKTIIQDHFPELAHTRIKIIFTKEKKCPYYMATSFLLFNHYIFIDHKTLRLSIHAFTAILAHELAHILIHTRKSFLRRSIQYLNRKNRETADEERQADTIVIERGLGHAMLQFHTEHNKSYRAYTKQDGLTKYEIKLLLKKR